MSCCWGDKNELCADLGALSEFVRELGDRGPIILQPVVVVLSALRPLHVEDLRRKKDYLC